MKRAFLVVLLLALVEVGWALLCVTQDVNFFVYYAGLIVASGVMWVPKVMGG